MAGDSPETRKVGFPPAVILDECMSGLCASVRRLLGYAARSASMESNRAARTAGKREVALATEKRDERQSRCGNLLCLAPPAGQHTDKHDFAGSSLPSGVRGISNLLV